MRLPFDSQPCYCLTPMEIYKESGVHAVMRDSVVRAFKLWLAVTP